MLINLDLKKNNIDNFEKIELDTIEYRNLEQDIIRSWEFLKKTHNLEMGECLIVVAILVKKYNNRNLGSKECIITEYDTDNFVKYSLFIKKYATHSWGAFSFFYKTYNFDYLKVEEIIRKESTPFRVPFVGENKNVSSTSILVADLDHCSYEEFKEVRQMFLDREIYPICLSSGHGYHIIVKIHNVADSKLLHKFVVLMDKNGVKVDLHCKDAARNFRLPFFLNVKAEYDTYARAEIIDGEYIDVPTYDAEEVFKKFDGDINYIEEEKVKYVNSSKKKTKKENNDIEPTYTDEEIQEFERIFDVNVDLIDLYKDIPVALFPTGIKNMLKGFQQGVTHYQVMCLVVFLKKYGYTLEQVQSILEITESINGNSWNNWDIDEKVEYFYKNFNGVPNLNDLRQQFGDIYFIEKDYKETYKIPLGITKSNEIQVYLFLLKNGPSIKAEILKGLGISNNKLDRIMQKAILIEKRNDSKYYLLNAIAEHYIYLDEKTINRLLNWKQNDIVVYLYLKWRAGEKNTIQTSIQSIEKDTLLSHTTVSNAIKTLEMREVLSVTRKEDNYKKLNDKNRESNIYELKEL